MRSLNYWFFRNMKFPLFVLGGIVAFVQIGFLSFAFFQGQQNHEKIINKLVSNIATLGIEQSNRPLIESSFQLAIEEFGVNSVLVCKKKKTLFAHPFENSCSEPRPASIFESRLKISPAGFKDYEFTFYSNRFQIEPVYIGLNALVLVFLGLVFLIIFRVQRRLSEDILQPLESHLTSDAELSVSELEDIRTKFDEFRKSKEQQAIASAILEHNCRISHNVKSLKQTIDSILESDFTSALQEKRIKNLSKDILSIMGQVDEAMPRGGLANPVLSEESFFEHLKTVNQLKSKVDILSFLEVTVDQKLTELSVASRPVDIELNIDSKLRGQFVEAVGSEFRSIFSNLINNAIEAKATKVVLSARLDNSSLICSVADNGEGVPTALRESVFERGFTSGKANGSGYGLYHAQKFLESWGGSIELAKSKSDGATEFTTQLPIWKSPELHLKDQKTIVILDDEELAHERWKARFEREGVSAQVHSFFDPRSFQSWFDAETNFSQTLFLIDHDLGRDVESGESVISDLGIESMAVLITNNYDSPGVLAACERSQIELIPKSFIFDEKVI